jgi:hypothetical protein
MWMGLRRLKTAVLLHRKRGGQALTIFFHSSELMPGGCPEHQTDTDVTGFLNKLRSFFSWLCNKVGPEPVTLSELSDTYSGDHVSSNITPHS